MSDPGQIDRQARRDGVPMPTVERDYVLAHIIAALGALGDGHSLVFKGGTALRLCYFEDYRYSADLDFSVVGGDIEGAYATIEEALALVTGAVEGLALTDDEPKQIVYQGPLGRQRYAKLDLTASELILNANTVSLLPSWPDLPERVAVSAYSLAEITGEKVCCVMQRMQCRDLFDLWHLLERPDVDSYDVTKVFFAKATSRSLDPSNFETRYRLQLEKYRHLWVNELKDYVPSEVPHFKEVERAVTRRLRGIGLL